MAADVDSLLAPLAAVASRLGIADFLRWWWGELTGMLPAGWRERLASRDTAYLCAMGDEWLAFRIVAGRLAQAGSVDLGSLDSAGRRGAFRRLLAEEPGAAGNVWLLLPQESVLVREVHMPLAAEEALRDAVGFELDRLTPLPAEHAWFDYRVTGRDAGAQRLALVLAVTARAPVEARLAELRELGATVLGVGVTDDVAGAPTPFNLLPPEKRDRPATSGATIAARALAAAAAMLALAALVYPLWLKREAVIALHPRTDKARASAQVAERLAKEIEKLASEHNFILARKQGQQPVVSILEDLSRLLPDTTWVQQLDVKAGAKVRELQIAGETGSSSQLIEVLERSEAFANATFKSPLTKGATPNTERFLVAAEVKARPLPEPIPEDALVTKASAPASAPTRAAPVPAAAAPVPAAAAHAPGAVAPAAGAAAPAPAAAAPVPAAAGGAPASSGGAAPVPANSTPSAPAASPGAAPASAPAALPSAAPASPSAPAAAPGKPSDAPAPAKPAEVPAPAKPAASRAPARPADSRATPKSAAKG